MFRKSSLLAILVLQVSSISFAQTGKLKSIPDWGDVVNPKKDCKIVPVDGELKMTLPAVAHDLSVEINRMNAPRVLQAASGDFSIQVKVSGVSHPQNQSVIAGRKPFCSAGLLIWKNERNYIRLERASLLNGAVVSTYASWELRQDGKFARAGQAGELPLTGEVSWLRITRTGNSFVGAASNDGIDWRPLPEITLQGADLQAGVLAINDTPKPFTPVFADFTLTANSAEK